MAEKRSGGDSQEPTLELPKLFGRRRAGAQTPAEDTDPAERAQPSEPVLEPSPVDETRVEPPAGDDTTAPVEEPGARKAQRTEPVLPPRLAAVIAGLVVGVVGTLLTYGSLRGCELLTGTGSCGGGPGLLLLVAIFAIMVLLGGALLRLWAVQDPQSTSFLAVGITAVVAMLTLLEAVFNPWMFVVVPLLSMAAYMVGHWVTSRFAEAPRDENGVDLR